MGACKTSQANSEQFDCTYMEMKKGQVKALLSLIGVGLRVYGGVSCECAKCHASTQQLQTAKMYFFMFFVCSLMADKASTIWVVLCCWSFYVKMHAEKNLY